MTRKKLNPMLMAASYVLIFPYSVYFLFNPVILNIIIYSISKQMYLRRNPETYEKLVSTYPLFLRFSRKYFKILMKSKARGIASELSEIFNIPLYAGKSE